MNAYQQRCLQIPHEVGQRLEERRILREDLQKAIHQAEISGKKFVDPARGRSLASYRPKTVTYWVEYSPVGDEYLIHDAYSHRMGLRTGGGMTDGATSAPSAIEGGWSCNCCNVPLETQTVRLQYMQCIFPLQLPVCPRCSAILIGSELAMGKVAEAEQILEDK